MGSDRKGLPHGLRERDEEGERKRDEKAKTSEIRWAIVYE